MCACLLASVFVKSKVIYWALKRNVVNTVFSTCRREKSVLMQHNARSLPRSVLCVINCH